MIRRRFPQFLKLFNRRPSRHLASIFSLPEQHNSANGPFDRFRTSRRFESEYRFPEHTNHKSLFLPWALAALALYFMYYNFCRVHQTLRVTPAMEAGIADHVWSVEEIVALLDRKEN